MHGDFISQPEKKDHKTRPIYKLYTEYREYYSMQEETSHINIGFGRPSGDA